MAINKHQLDLTRIAKFKQDLIANKDKIQNYKIKRIILKIKTPYNGG